MTIRYPRVRIAGAPFERGCRYGREARDRIRASLAAYAEVFGAYAGWEWRRATKEARRFGPAIADFDERYLEEMRGLAEGAGVGFDDILALNVRTEIMYAAKAREAEREAMRRIDGCTSFAVLPSRSRGGHTLIGQNWDWLLHSFDTVIVLEVQQDDRPDFVTVVEAGLLAKTGMNSSGIGLATNALATENDRGEPGVPYHVLLRALLDAETMSDALATLQRRPRSSSANYLLAHEDGLALDVEAAPGDFSRLFLLYPERGLLLHTNHFRSSAFDGKDVSRWAMPDSPIRLARLEDTLTREALSVETFEELLADHANFPNGICCHADERLAPHERGATVASLIMDLDARTLWLSEGPPCSTPYAELEYAGLLAKPSPVAQDQQARAAP